MNETYVSTSFFSVLNFLTASIFNGDSSKGRVNIYLKIDMLYDKNV
jgi:hypothetical protein